VPGLAIVTGKVGTGAPVTLPVSDPPGSTDKPFSGWVGVLDNDELSGIPAGSATVTIDVADYDIPPQTEDETVSMTVVAGANKSFIYDENGNTTSITDYATSKTTTFEWDAADQLRRITYHDGTATKFQYDAMGRRVWQGEYDDEEGLESSKYFVWDGLSIVEERDGDDDEIVTRRYFAQGEIRDETKYFYGRDHLGSVREVVDLSLNVVARYDYDPYGRREQTVGEGIFDVDWGFTGHYFHKASGLHLAPFRAYSAELGRWLSRDPIGESDGANLYAYVHNNPVNFVDPLGLYTSCHKYPAACAWAFEVGRGAGAVAGSKAGGAALSGLLDAVPESKLKG
jgi:RHS repeat-associated protein